MNERLKNIAKKIASKKLSFETPQECYESIYPIFNKERMYFDTFNPLQKLMIIILVYSLKTYGDFKFAEQVFSRMFFVCLFMTDKNYYEEDCEDCSGGYNRCDECDGTGNIECSECDGEGEVTCSDCDGAGTVEGDNGEEVTCEYCDGTGMVDCSECGGDGKETCDECSGGGEKTCDTCDGDGYIETDRFLYTKYNILSWDPNFNTTCETYLNTYTPVLTQESFEKIYPFSIILSNEVENQDFSDIDEIEEDSYYCFYISDDADNFVAKWNAFYIKGYPSHYL